MGRLRGPDRRDRLGGAAVCLGGLRDPRHDGNLRGGHRRRGLLGRGVVALVLTAALRSPKRAVAGVLLGMLFRMGVPLGTGIFLHRQGGPLAKAGVFGMILGFYLLTLLVETLLALRLLAPRAKRVSRSPVSSETPGFFSEDPPD